MLNSRSVQKCNVEPRNHSFVSHLHAQVQVSAAQSFFFDQMYSDPKTLN
jgi:hypothetical protein